MGLSARSRGFHSARLPELGKRERWKDSAAEIEDRKTPDPSYKLERQMILDFLERRLSREEKLVLELYYLEGLNQKEIGRVIDLSESGVSQIRLDILRRFRERFGLEKERRKLVGLVCCRSEDSAESLRRHSQWVLRTL